MLIFVTKIDKNKFNKAISNITKFLNYDNLYKKQMNNPNSSCFLCL